MVPGSPELDSTPLGSLQKVFQEAAKSVLGWLWELQEMLLILQKNQTNPEQLKRAGREDPVALWQSMFFACRSFQIWSISSPLKRSWAEGVAMKLTLPGESLPIRVDCLGLDSRMSSFEANFICSWKRLGNNLDPPECFCGQKDFWSQSATSFSMLGAQIPTPNPATLGGVLSCSKKEAEMLVLHG